MNAPQRAYRPVDLSCYEWADSIVDDGWNIIYLHAAQFPVLEIQVVLRERAREQMGDIEWAVLNLVKSTPIDINILAALMGFSKHRMIPIVIELQGRGLLEERDDRWRLTELGELSLKNGAEVVEVQRALLLCGITGRLMPCEAYDAPRSTVEELGRRMFGRVLIDDAQTIPTSYLDICDISNKRSVNIPDEALEITRILSHEPRFLSGTLAIYEARGRRRQGEVRFGGASVDWVPVERLIPLIEPIGWPKYTPEQVLNELHQELLDSGCVIGSREYDDDGNPTFYVSSMSVAAQQIRVGQKPLALFVGTDAYEPIPIFRFPEKQDKLAGHPLRLIASSDQLKGDIACLRTVSHGMDEYYKAKSGIGMRDVPLEAYIRAKIESNGLSFEHTSKVVDAIKYGRLQRVFERKQD